MSRLSKYLRQKCSYEKAQRNSTGDIVFDKYGEPLYEPPVLVKCRCEVTMKDVQTSTGAVVQSSIRYFTDDTHQIRVGDKLDNKHVLIVQEYINQFGTVEGFEVYV